MARFALIGCAATLLVTLTPVPSRAEPINITSGSVFIPDGGASNGTLSIAGTRGFSVVGTVTPSANVTGPFDQCFVPECPPGTSIGLDLNLTGASGILSGTMTIEGDRFDVSSNVNALADVLLSFDGSIVAPDMGPAQQTVSAPFSLTGRAFALTPLGEIAHDDPVFGRGIATVTLVPFPPESGFAPSWMVNSVRFDFAQPIPEPSTLLLLGTGALMAVKARRSRRSRASAS